MRSSIPVAPTAIALTAAMVAIAIATMARVALSATVACFLRTRFRDRALGGLAGE